MRGYGSRLAFAVAIEDRAYLVEVVVNDKVKGFSDLPFPALAVPDQAVDIPIRIVQPCGECKPRRDRQTHPQGARCCIEEREAFGRIRVTVEDARECSKLLRSRMLSGHASAGSLPTTPSRSA